MTIIDRYLLFQFFKIFTICLVSFAGLYVVIHVFTNLDEVVDILGQEEGLKSLSVDFYGPRVLDFFNRMAGVLILVAAVFSITMMQRRRETTATEAAGVTKARLVMPIIVAAVFVIAGAAVCREIYIPQYKAMLVRSLTNWTASGVVAMNHYRDVETGILIQGDSFNVAENLISEVQLKLPRRISPDFLDVTAEHGIIREKSEDQVAGLLLLNVDEPERYANMKNVVWNGAVLIYTPSDNPTLHENQLFVACRLDVQEIAYGNSLNQYSSLKEMIDKIQRPSRSFGLGNQVAIHGRILKPVLELTLVLMGLPLVICKTDRNIFVAAALCTLVIILLEVTTMASHAMGSYRIIPSASLAAWIPVILFLPATALTLRKLFE